MSDPSDYYEDPSSGPQGQLPELHQKPKMELGGVDVSGYDGQLSPAPAHLLVTEGERTIEGARERLRRLTNAAMKAAQDHVMSEDFQTLCRPGTTDYDLAIEGLAAKFAEAAREYLEVRKKLALNGTFSPSDPSQIRHIMGE
jgi:hypothetical protein